jgi:hypothetical protein
VVGLADDSDAIGDHLDPLLRAQMLRAEILRVPQGSPSRFSVQVPVNQPAQLIRPLHLPVPIRDDLERELLHLLARERRQKCSFQLVIHRDSLAYYK